MTTPIIKVDDAGIEPAHRTTIKNRLDESQREAFGSDLSKSPHVATEQWSGILSVALAEMAQSFVSAINNASDVDRASGPALDAISRLLDIRRNKETFTTTIATFYGDPGTKIRAGTRALTKSGSEFVSTQDGIIQENGSVKIPMRSLSAGAIQLGTGDIEKLSTIVTGVDFVTNEIPGVIGQDRETDAQFRKRFLARTAHSSIGPKAGILAALEEVGAGQTSLIENSSSSDIIEDGVYIPAHGILVIAEKGSPDALTTAIENHRGMGVATTTALIGSYPPKKTTPISAKLDFNGTDATIVQGATAAALVSGTDANTNGLAEKPYRTLLTGDRVALWSRWDPDMSGLKEASERTSDPAVVRHRPKPIRAYTQVSTPGTPEATPSHWHVFIEFDAFVGSNYSAGYKASVKNKDTGQKITSINDISANQFGRIICVRIKRLHSNQTGIPDLKSDLENGKIQVSVPRSNLLKTDGGLFVDPVVDIDIEHETVQPQPPIAFVSSASPSLKRIVLTVLHPFQAGADRFEWKLHINGGFTTDDWIQEDFSSDDWAYKGVLQQDSNWDLKSYDDIYALLRTIGPNGNKSDVIRIRILQKDIRDYQPSIEGKIFVDGNLARIGFDGFINQRQSEKSSSLISNSLPTVKSGSTSVSFSEFSIQDRFVYMKSTTAFSESDVVSWIDDWTNNQAFAIHNGIGLAATGTTRTDYTNQTKTGVPSVPSPVWTEAVEVSGKKRVNLKWWNNGNGGNPIDVWEVQTSDDEGVTWGEWTAVTMEDGDTTEGYLPVVEWPTHVRMRVGNANTRPGKALGLPSGAEMVPFVRPVEEPIVVSMTIADSNDLPAGFHDTIRNTLVSRVGSTPIGKALLVKDLRAIVEQTVGIGVDAFVATSDGVSIDSVSVSKLTKWVLDSSNITVEIK